MIFLNAGYLNWDSTSIVHYTVCCTRAYQNYNQENTWSLDKAPYINTIFCIFNMYQYFVYYFSKLI